MKPLLIIITLCINLSDLATAEKNNITPVEGIPNKWVEQKGNDVLRYANYIKSLNLKNIAPSVVLDPHFKECDGVFNSLPPKDKWKEIAKILEIVDKLASALEADVQPFIVAYRSPEFHKAVGGKPKSHYLANKAVRVKFDGVSASEVARVARKLRLGGLFKGGVGLYSDSVYLDTRGHNVDW